MTEQPPSHGTVPGCIQTRSHIVQNVVRQLRPPGLVVAWEFLSRADESELLSAVSSLAFSEVRMRGVAARRTVVHYGWKYGFEGRRLEPAEPFPPLLVWVRERVAALAEVAPESLEAGLVARYPPGAGIGWHRDAPGFGPAVVGISLGERCVMRFRPHEPSERAKQVRMLLEPRSAYVLSGPARSEWEHSIPPVGGLRYSVTFRMLG